MDPGGTSLLDPPGAPPMGPPGAPPAPPPPPPEPDRKDADILLKMRDTGIDKRKTFLDMYEELEYFSYAPDYNERLYDGEQREAEKSNDYFFKAKVNRASEFLEVIGPYLFPRVPDAQVNSKKWATYWARQRHHVEQDYVDYVAWEGDFQGHMRKCVSEGCLSGRGVMYTGYNPTKKIVQPVYRSCKDLILDPDARCTEELNWVAVRRRCPKWELKAKIQNIRGDDSMDDQIDGLKEITESGNSSAPTKTGDTVEYYEFYLKVGLWRFGNTQFGAIDDGSGTLTQDDSPKKYYWTPGNILAVDEWEIPFYDIDEWPVSWLDLRPRPNHIWPSAPMAPGLGHLKALNWLYTFYINRVRIASRTFFAVADYNGQTVEEDELMKIVYSGDMALLKFKVNGNELKFADLVQQFKMDANVEEFKNAWEIVSSEFAKSTALSEILYAGEGQRQSRIKADVDFKSKQSQNRIEDMKGRVQDFMSRQYRKMLFAARYMEQPADIMPILGPQAAAVWGTIGPPQLVSQEQQERAGQKKQLQAMAQQKIQFMQQAVANWPPPPLPVAIGKHAVPDTPANWKPPPPIPPMPTDDDLEQQIGPPRTVSLDAWITEADRQVDAGTTRIMDHDAKLDNLHAVITQLAPILNAMPGGQHVVAMSLKELGELSQYSLDWQNAVAICVQKTLMAPNPGQMGPSAPATAQPNGAPPLAG